MQRYLDQEWAVFHQLFEQADALSEEPLHGFLIFFKLFADLMADLPSGHPGCLVASYVYSEHLFSPEVRSMTTEGHRIWRRRFGERLCIIAEKYPPKGDICLNDLADMLSAVSDGGIILSKSLHDPVVLPKQIILYRSFIKATFVD